MHKRKRGENQTCRGHLSLSLSSLSLSIYLSIYLIYLYLSLLSLLSLLSHTLSPLCSLSLSLSLFSSLLYPTPYSLFAFFLLFAFLWISDYFHFSGFRGSISSATSLLCEPHVSTDATLQQTPSKCCRWPSLPSADSAPRNCPRQNLSKQQNKHTSRKINRGV